MYSVEFTGLETVILLCGFYLAAAAAAGIWECYIHRKDKESE